MLAAVASRAPIAGSIFFLLLLDKPRCQCGGLEKSWGRIERANAWETGLMTLSVAACSLGRLLVRLKGLSKTAEEAFRATRDSLAALPS